MSCPTNDVVEDAFPPAFGPSSATCPRSSVLCFQTSLGVAAAQEFGEPVKPGIAAALSLDLGDGREDIFEICPGSAMTLTYQMELALEIKTPSILRMAAIDDVYECGDGPRRIGCERDPVHGFAID